MLDGRVVHIHDIHGDPEYAVTGVLTLGRTRTMLGVPLMREGAPIGVLTLSRSRVQPFTDKQIELATTFADQAVIAIENVRLFDEVQTRTEELGEIATAADRDRRRTQGHQPLDVRAAAYLRHTGRERRQVMRGREGVPLPVRR